MPMLLGLQKAALPRVTSSTWQRAAHLRSRRSYHGQAWDRQAKNEASGKSSAAAEGAPGAWREAGELQRGSERQPLPQPDQQQQQQQQQQQGSLEASDMTEIGPRLVLDQPSMQAVLALLRSVPRSQLSAAGLSAALHRADRAIAKQRKSGGGSGSGSRGSGEGGWDDEGAAEAAAAQAIVVLAWANMRTLRGGGLVDLLCATSWLAVPTRSQMAAWLAAMEDCNGLRDLFPNQRVSLLDVARRLAAAPGGAAVHLPRRLLGRNLSMVCSPSRTWRLNLNQIAIVYRCARELGLRLTAEQHGALAAAVPRHLGPSSAPMGTYLTEVLNIWAGMEHDFKAWRREVDRAKNDGNPQGAGGKGEEGIAGAGGGSDSSGGGSMGAAQARAGRGQQQPAGTPPSRSPPPSRPPPPPPPSQPLPPPQAWQLQWQAEHWPQWRDMYRRQEEERLTERLLAMAPEPSCWYPPREDDQQAQSTAAAGGAVSWYQPPSGYPGDEVMEAAVRHVHFHRAEMGSWALGQTLGALSTLRYAPPQQVVVDIAEALAAQLTGPEQAREATAAIAGVAILGIYPGEALCKACLKLALADRGADEQLLTKVAWALALLEYCTPEQWRALVALWRPSTDARGKTVAPGPKEAMMMWFTAYRLMLARYARQPGARAPAPAGAPTPGAGPGTPMAVAPLPPQLLSQGAAVAWDLAREPLGAGRRWLHGEIAEALRQLCGPSLEVVEGYHLEDPATGVPIVLDVAVPRLRFSLRACVMHDVTRNTQTPLSVSAAGMALARGLGWEAAALPPAPELARRELRQYIRAFLLEHTRLPQLLMGPSVVWPEGIAGSGWDLEGEFERIS